MTANTINKVIILGSGPAGYTAAIYAARAQLTPLIIEGQQPGGQLTTTTEIENFPGFEQGISGVELMDNMAAQAKRFGAKIVGGFVSRIDFSAKPFRVFCDEREYLAASIIIATGATPKMLGLPEEKLLLGKGLSICATCDGAFFPNQEIVVVGGGDAACEEAIFLTRFAQRVRLIHRRNELRASKIMIERLASNKKIEVIWNSIITKLVSGPKGLLTGALIKDLLTDTESEVACAAVFYAIGHKPNSDLFKGVLHLDRNGYVATKPGTCTTNIPGVFACGDVQDHTYRQAITAAGTGCMAAIECARYLEGA